MRQADPGRQAGGATGDDNLHLLEALPETTTCIWCSKVVRPRTEADVDVDDGHDGDDLVRSGQSMVYRDRR